jgi:hypothetical protein
MYQGNGRWGAERRLREHTGTLGGFVGGFQMLIEMGIAKVLTR